MQRLASVNMQVNMQKLSFTPSLFDSPALLILFVFVFIIGLSYVYFPYFSYSVFYDCSLSALLFSLALLQ